jgi:hypothetical protein
MREEAWQRQKALAPASIFRVSICTFALVKQIMQHSK